MIVCNIALALLALAVSPVSLGLVERMGAGVAPSLPIAAWLGVGVALVAKFVVLDLWTDALHRAYHRVPAMWRLHGPHHLDAHFGATSAFRFRAGEIMLSGVPRLVPALPAAADRLLAPVIVTPAMHRLHHHAQTADTDSNYGAILMLRDAMSTSHNPSRWSHAMPMGVEGEREEPLAQQLTRPFR